MMLKSLICHSEWNEESLSNIWNADPFGRGALPQDGNGDTHCTRGNTPQSSM